MKKKMLLFIILCLICITIKADDYEKLKILKEEKKALSIQMHKKRTEIIKKDPSLLELQKKIIALHKELAIRIDNNQEMREMVSKLRDINTQIKLIEGGDE